MKKLLGLLLLFIGFAFTSFSQSTINDNTVIGIGGTTADTVIKNSIKYYPYYVSGTKGYKWNYGVSFNATATRLTGTYTKVRFVLQKSLDYSKWYAVDSITIASATTPYTSILEFKTVYANYFRIKVYAFDSTQKIKSQIYLLPELK